MCVHTTCTHFHQASRKLGNAGFQGSGQFLVASGKVDGDVFSQRNVYTCSVVKETLSVVVVHTSASPSPYNMQLPSSLGARVTSLDFLECFDKG